MSYSPIGGLVSWMGKVSSSFRNAGERRFAKALAHQRGPHWLEFPAKRVSIRCGSGSVEHLYAKYTKFYTYYYHSITKVIG